jgi:hypothetical protein
MPSGHRGFSVGATEHIESRVPIHHFSFGSGCVSRVARARVHRSSGCARVAENFSSSLRTPNLGVTCADRSIGRIDGSP